MGQQLRNVLAPTVPVQPAQPAAVAPPVVAVAAPVAEAAPQAAPRAKRTPLLKTTVWLHRKRVADLDQQALNIRRRTGAVISRSDIVRALVDAFLAAGVDIRDAETEDDVRRTILARMGAGQGGP